MTTVLLVAEGDLVTVVWTATGTNTGQGNGLPATGKKVAGRGITVWRIVDGKIREEWSEFDSLRLGTRSRHRVSVKCRSRKLLA